MCRLCPGLRAARSKPPGGDSARAGRAASMSGMYQVFMQLLTRSLTCFWWSGMLSPAPCTSMQRAVFDDGPGLAWVH